MIQLTALIMHVDVCLLAHAEVINFVALIYYFVVPVASLRLCIPLYYCCGSDLTDTCTVAAAFRKGKEVGVHITLALEKSLAKSRQPAFTSGKNGVFKFIANSQIRAEIRSSASIRAGYEPN